MILRLLGIGLLLSVSLALEPISIGTYLAVEQEKEQHISTDACREEINEHLASEQVHYDSVLFGVRSPEDDPIGRVRYDQDGSAWKKVSQSRWESRNEGGKGRSNSEMKTHARFAERRGIVQMRTLGSDPEYIHRRLHARWAYECRLRLVCALALESAKHAGQEPLSIGEDRLVSVPGCLPLHKLEQEAVTLVSCHAENPGGTHAIQADILSYCMRATEDLITLADSEQRMLTQYDAVRSLAQLAGILDQFLIEWRAPLTGTLRDVASLFGRFSSIPCFVSSCSAAPPAIEDPFLERQ